MGLETHKINGMKLKSDLMLDIRRARGSLLSFMPFILWARVPSRNRRGVGPAPTPQIFWAVLAALGPPENLGGVSPARPPSISRCDSRQIGIDSGIRLRRSSICSHTAGRHGPGRGIVIYLLKTPSGGGQTAIFSTTQPWKVCSHSRLCLGDAPNSRRSTLSGRRSRSKCLSVEVN